MANIHQKILNVMSAIEYLNKDDAVKYGQTSYKAMSEEKVTTTVRKELIKQGLVVFPIKQDVVKDGNITTTNTTYRMVNVDDPTDYIDLASSGQGADTQDKGVGKAMTYSFKYLLLCSLRRYPASSNSLKALRILASPSSNRVTRPFTE